MKRILFVLVVLCLLLTGCVSQSTYETLQKENEDLKAKVEEQQLFLDAADKLLNDFHEEIKLYKETFGEVQDGVKMPYYRMDELGRETLPMIIINNPKAINHTWEQLESFLGKDKTENVRYWDLEDFGVQPASNGQPCECEDNCDYGIFVCSDFAIRLHDNAEAEGIRSAIVIVHIEGKKDPHAINAFITTNRGLVFIDCTGAEDCNGFDKVCYIKKGEELFGFELQDNTLWDNARLLEQKQLWDEYREIIEQYKIGLAKTDYYKGAYGIVGLEASVWSSIINRYCYPPADYEFSVNICNKQELLNSKLEKLGMKQLIPIFELKGTVTEVEIYW